MVTRASLLAPTVKNLLPMWETWVQSLCGEAPPEKGIAARSSILAWRIHGQRSLAGYSPWGCLELNTADRLTLSLSGYQAAQGKPILRIRETSQISRLSWEAQLKLNYVKD